MKRKTTPKNSARSEAAGVRAAGPAPRPLRADAQRNVASLLEAAKVVMGQLGVNAPAKDITDRAGVGIGTLYRHFPQRSDLIRAVLQRELAGCVEAASALSREQEPGAALEQWLIHYTEFVATKRGLAAALHSGDPAFDALPSYFFQQLDPVMERLLAAATATGDIRTGTSARSLLYAVGQLCIPIPDAEPTHSQRMVALLVDGLRFGATAERSRQTAAEGVMP